MIKEKTICPLGAVCEEIKGKTLYRCRWYKHLKGKNPQSEEILDEYDCAIGWIPLLLCENAQTNRGQTAALESFRNEMVRDNAALTGLIAGSVKLIG